MEAGNAAIKWKQVGWSMVHEEPLLRRQMPIAELPLDRLMRMLLAWLRRYHVEHSRVVIDALPWQFPPPVLWPIRRIPL